MFKHILIVCTGNICRSPIAEGMLRAHLPEGRDVSSAGLAALIGAPADPLAVEVMRENGYDITAHRGRQVVLPMLAQSDLILAMDQGHSTALLRQYPQLRGRVHKMLRWRGNGDVADPFRQPKSAFEQAYEDIDLGVRDWLPRIVRVGAGHKV
jgi:protein-tyrosine phosphatase